ncbi:hypothetical protein [Denitrificimonas caeni]|uniref:hypothetical protein n=1 Tax=Denitrificimonas caeni TaxID=521720 RepID=UPI0019659757|nr:hypothetical protein [Denitrificimonas caeni]
MQNKSSKVVERFITKHGEDALIELLSPQGEENILTIISNAGIHPYHELHKRGEVFFASEGSFDFTSGESALAEIDKVLVRVAKKLKEKRWTRVYLVPFGPAPLSLQIKSVVHKILDIETVDVLHIGNGAHVDISINPRSIALRASE